MSKSDFSFLYTIIKIIILTVLLWLFFFIILQIEPIARFVHPYFHEMIIYSAIVAVIVAYFTYININAAGTSKYVAVILGSATIRMILSIIIIFILLLRRPEDRLFLVINFLIIYLSYLLFEIYSIITNLRRISKKDNNYGE